MKSLVSLLLLSLWAVPAFSQEFLAQVIPHPYIAHHNNSENEVMQITSGMAALQQRIEMIRRAKRRIEVEYFIYNTDLAGKISTRELVDAARRGVKVRILIDKSKPIFEFGEAYAKTLADQGIEVRYYNKAPMVRVSTVQFRSHKKMISIDDREAITGGRNIGDDYFDLSPKFNFNDTDIYVRGPIVKTMREAFDKYFEHKISERPVLPAEKSEKALSFLSESKEETKTRELLKRVGGKILAETKLHVCPETTFVTDAPGANFFQRLNPKFDEKYKFIRKVLFDKLSRVEKSVLLSTPYLLANKHSNALMKGLLKRNIDITVYTNSLASTDAVYVAANLYYDVFKWTRKGIQIYLHDGLFVNNNPEVPEASKKARWGTHSKVQVYENHNSSEAMIGTYNVDNRSNFYNSEMAIFCKGNDEFTQEVKS